MTNTVNTKTHTDIKRPIWMGYLPKKLAPYAILMRLDRPIGIWLLLLPSLWSISLASGGIFSFTVQTWKTIILFYLGAIIMRGAGCVINDIWDRDLDKMVARTKARPIASGKITTKQGILFLGILLLLGFVILLQFNIITIVLGICTIPLIITYPLMKRITWWPQVFLGLTFNFGALMGWSAVTGEISPVSLFLYLAGIFWTIGYDTIYAHQDKDDDIMAGIKSTALKFGKHSKFWVSGFYGVSLTCLIIAKIFATGLNVSMILTLLSALHLFWQTKTWDINNSENSLKIFKSNRDFGILVLLALSI